MSEVENALLAQREIWREITGRVASIRAGDLPAEGPKRILLFGIGSSYFAAKLTAYSLFRDKGRTRIPVIACTSTEMGLDVIPQKGDWAFGFSHRGKTPPTLHALEMCDRAGALPILVCGQGAPESAHVRFVLTTSPQEKVEPHTMSVSGAICAVTSLLLGPKAQEEWDALQYLGSPNLDLLRERVGMGPSVVLGQWEGEWLAREGALKLMEMARVPVRAFGTEEFFHGPRLSVGSDDSLWHVAMSQDPRSKDLEKSFRVTHRVSITGGSPLSWVPALLELQWSALAVALNRGVNPDGA